MDSVKVKFHGVWYECSVKGLEDSSTRIALDFVARAEETGWHVLEASRKLREATQDLTLAIGEARSFKEIGDMQERYQTALQGFEGLHRKWVTQSTSALSVLRDYWTEVQSQD